MSKITTRKTKVIRGGSKFKIKKAPIWEGHLGEVLSTRKVGRRTFITGEMDNGFIGEWPVSQIRFI